MQSSHKGFASTCTQHLFSHWSIFDSFIFLKLYKGLSKLRKDMPYLYHLVLNMSRLSLEQALREVVALVQK